jgi:hypothetical protein
MTDSGASVIAAGLCNVPLLKALHLEHNFIDEEPTFGKERMIDMLRLNFLYFLSFYLVLVGGET